MSDPAVLDVPAEPLLPGAVDQYVTADVPVCAPETRADELRGLLTARPYASVADVAVCTPDDGRRLLGLIPVGVVLAAPSDARAHDLMDADPPVVAHTVDEEVAAWKAVRHGEGSLAVVGADGSFRGLVPPTRLLGVLLQEHDEDLARLGGFLASTSSTRHVTEEPVTARLWHRVPWLLIGLVGSALAALVVGGFEEQLAQDVRLAFFLPGIVYLADAVGTQTETLVIRGMSVGVSIRRIVWSEVLTGLLIGVVLGGLAGLATGLVTGSADLAVVVAVSLLLACAVATAVAMLLPGVLRRFGTDPAFGAGPLATVVQDLLSIVLYFVVAGAVLT